VGLSRSGHTKKGGVSWRLRIQPCRRKSASVVCWGFHASICAARWISNRLRRLSNNIAPIIGWPCAPWPSVHRATNAANPPIYRLAVRALAERPPRHERGQSPHLSASPCRPIARTRAATVIHPVRSADVFAMHHVVIRRACRYHASILFAGRRAVPRSVGPRCFDGAVPEMARRPRRPLRSPISSTRRSRRACRRHAEQTALHTG